jgi:hemoglobin/transferrin/lactoferrin receptor protein
MGDVMSVRVLSCAALLLLAFCSAAVAADDPSTAKEPTLPPVIVRPDETPPVEATDTAAAAERGPYDRTLTYPRLSEQSFGTDGLGGLDSLTRNDKSLFDTSTSDTIIGRELLVEKQPSNMVQALQNEVGVLMQQTARGQSSPFLRGLTGQQVLILIDGVRMNNSVFRNGPNQYFSLIDPGQVERIEIVRGPQSVLWGSDAIGGAINVVTRSASQKKGAYTGAGFVEYFSTADTASYTRANVEGWGGNGGFFGGASYLNVNDLRRGGDLGVQPFTNYDQYAADVKFNYLVGSDALLTFALQHFEQQNVPRSDRFLPFALGPPASTPRPTWFDPQQRDLAYIRLQGLSDSSLFDAYSTTLSFAWNKEGSRELRSATRTDLGQWETGTLGATVAFVRDLDSLGKLTYGVDYYRDDVDAYRNRLNPVSGSVSADNPQFPNDSRYQRAGTFLNWDVAVTQRLDATAGVRYENADAGGTLNAVRGTPLPFEKSYQGWIASTGLVYKVNPMFHLVGNVSEGWRAPNLDDLTADNPVLQNAQDLPSLDVKPERARTYEIGFKVDTPRLRMQVFEFWTDLQDNIQRQAVDALGNPAPNVVGPYGTLIPGSSNFVRSNFDSYLNGTELSGEYLLPDGWSLYGNAWYTYGQDLVRDEPLSRVPPLQGTLGTRWRDECHRKWFDVYTWLVARQDRYNPQNNIDARFPLEGTPGYATLNVRMGTALGRCNRHRLSLTLENITDARYRVLGSGVDGAGFNAILGYELVQ